MAPQVYSITSTFRTLSSCFMVGRPGYRLFTTIIPSQATAATRSVTSPDTSSLDKKTRELEFKLVQKPKVKRLIPPKRPWTIMQLVIQDVVAKEKSATGKLTGSQTRECFRLAGERYRCLSDEERKSYQAELERRRQVYEIEMQQFLDSLTPQDYINQNEYIRRRRAQGRSTARRGIPKLDPNAPKRPLNGFLLFCADLRADPSKFGDFPGFPVNSTNSVGDASKLLAAYWREMDEDVKQEYLLEAQRLRELYKQEKENYTNKSGLQT